MVFGALLGSIIALGPGDGRGEREQRDVNVERTDQDENVPVRKTDPQNGNDTSEPNDGAER